MKKESDRNTNHRERYFNRIDEYLKTNCKTTLKEFCSNHYAVEYESVTRRSFFDTDPALKGVDRRFMIPFRWTLACCLILAYDVPINLLLLNMDIVDGKLVDEDRWIQYLERVNQLKEKDPDYSKKARTGPKRLTSKNMGELYTKYSPVHGVEDVIRLTDYGRDKFAEQYFNNVKRYIHDLDTRLWVYEYLGKGTQYSTGHILPHYAAAHKLVFDAVLERLSSKQLNIQYRRLLAIPVDNPSWKITKEHKSNAFWRDEFSEHWYCMIALTECSVQVVEHLCKLFSSQSIKFEIYVVFKPSRIYHYAIFDKKYVVSEYYRYDNAGDYVPDLLTVANTQSGKLRKFLKCYDRDVKAVVNNSHRSLRVTKTEFLKSILLAYQFAAMKIALLKKSDDTVEMDRWKAKKEILLSKFAFIKDYISANTDNQKESLMKIVDIFGSVHYAPDEIDSEEDK